MNDAQKHHPPAMTGRPSTPSPHRMLLAVALFALACAALTSWPGDAAAASTVSWSKCYVRSGPFECATVRVPLDYDHPHGEQIALALTRLPATEPDHRIGSLFLNPGGPGGSGVDFVVGVGQDLYTPEVRARFDLVGFDPRGIMRSGGLRCFGTPKQWGRAFTPFAFPITPDEEAATAEANRYLVDACRQRGTRVLDHMSTANVARDMDVLRRAVGDDKLSYSGGSYGSYLGVTYANMFPERVRAVVVDGVVDPIAWSTGRGDEALTVPFSTRLRTHVGAQATLEEFFRLCDAAGSACALSGGAAARFAAIAERARQAPLKLVFPDGSTAELDYSNLIAITHEVLTFSPIWADYAQVLAGTEASSSPATAGARLHAFMAKYGQSLYPNFIEGNPAVACEDSDSPDSYSAWSAAGAQADESSYFGRLWTWGWSACAAWKAVDEDRYMGPFDKATANPVLAVNPRFDPSTPLHGAVAVHELMPNSALLTVNGWGHTSLFMSRCADAVIERYLVDIATPPPGTTCDQDVAPFTTAAAPSAPAAQKRLQALSYINGQSSRARPRARRAQAAGRRSAVDGASWSDLAGSAIDALRAQVAVDDRGNAVYAWSSSDASTGITQVQARTRSAKGGLGPIVVLSDPAADAFDVRVAVNASGAAAFSWLQFDATASTMVVKTRSWSARGVLGPVADVSDPAIGAFEHRIAIAADGAAAFAWTQGDPATGPTRVHARVRSTAGALGAVVDLADPALDSFAPQVAIDAGSVATFAWTQSDPTIRRTRVQTRTLSPSGALGPIADLADGTRNTGDAKVAIDRAGDALFAWLASDQSMRSVVQTRSRSHTGAFGPVAELSGSADEASDPVVAIDGDGDGVVAWWIVGRTGARVEARSRSAHGTIGPRVTLSDAADDAYEPNVAIDDDGDAVLTWLAFTRDGVRVQARSRSPHGALGPLTDLTRPAQDAFSAQVAVSRGGDAAFGWSALTDAGYRVQGRSRSANGRLGPLATISTVDRDTFEAQVNTTTERLEHAGGHG